MSDSLLREKNQITLPGDVVQSAGLSPSDRIAWRFEHGEIIGRKLVGEKPGWREANLVKDPKTGMLYFDCDLTYEEIEAAALAQPPHLPL